MNVTETIAFLRSNSLTFSARPGKLEVVHTMADRVEAAGVPGVFLEAGVAMGGSAIVIARTKAPDRPLRLYDVFAMMPPPGDRDDAASHADHTALLEGVVGREADRVYLEHSGDLPAFTRENMRRVGIDPDREGIEFIKGLYEDTLRIDEPVAFAHVDCDWYDSVRLCTERIADRMSPGGIVLFDDYVVYDGCRRAVHEWLGRDDRFRVIHADRTLAVQRTSG
ncbi:TylF/MycF/NovP-related O-methyltransferase [Streptomyces cucumeris]|uniref:TylF/MycF/NovP-related O-methyltransferase n=1 Tax=Streptomyces cucumeris TaxID=2962890 RepID=UPI003D720AD3